MNFQSEFMRKKNYNFIKIILKINLEISLYMYIVDTMEKLI